MRRWPKAALALFLVASAYADPRHDGVQLKDPLEGTFYDAETTLEDQTDVAVTVYNNNLALVRDRRNVVLYPGEVSLRFMDVAQQVRPETVSLRSLTEPDALSIVEQNYEYDLMSPAKLMEKYVGRPVRLVNFSTEIGFREQEAVLLSVNDGPVYQVDAAVYLGYPGQVVLPEVPEDLIARPSLIWLLANRGTDHEIEVTYLTGGIEWRADYVITLDRSDERMDLEGWVTLNNQSGTQYTEARLKLVAGDVHIVQPEARMDLNSFYAAKAAAAPPPMQEEAFAEYHLYTLARRTTIKQNETKQVSLLTAADIAVAKVYEYRGNQGFYSQPIPPQKDQKVGVFLEFANSKENQLGAPLPAGVMRVYQEDTQGMLQFAGEDRVEHTPKDEDVRLRLGNAFDVVGERIQTDFQRVADRVFESAYEITIRNHKEADVVVDIIEPMTDDWRMLENSHEFVKRDARTAVFSVSVPKGGETAVTYRVRVKH